MSSSSSGAERSQRNSNATASAGTSQSPHGPGGMSRPGPNQAHYGMTPYGGSGSNTGMNSDSNRYSDNTQRLSHGGSKSLHRTPDSSNSSGAPAPQPPPPAQPPPTQPQTQNVGPVPPSSSRPVGRSPHMSSGSASSFYPSGQFQSPPRSQSGGGASGGGGNPPSAPMPTPPLHHHGSRIMETSAPSSMSRPSGYSHGSNSGPTQQAPFGGSSSSYSGSSVGFDPAPLHYSGNRPPSTQSTASAQSLPAQKSTAQSRSDSRSSSTKSSASTNKNSQKSSSSSTSRSKQSSKKGSSSSSAGPGGKYEVDTNLSNSIFETRSMTPMFPGMGLSPPPSRNLPTDGPTYIHGNLFNAPRSLSNSGPLQHKGHPGDMPFNPLFPSSAGRGPQNGLGLNFQPGFPGMNPHGSHQTSGHVTPHTTSVSMPPHLPAGYLGNSLFTEMTSANNGPQGGQGEGLNISPIKFQHGAHNPILGPPQPPPGLPDHPPGLQHHHHQGPPPPALYSHNRAHPAMGINPMAAGMSINSLLGQHHGFDPRAMTPSSMAPPFLQQHSFSVPNFLMPDH